MGIKNPTFFAGLYRALSFAYGIVSDVPGLLVDEPSGPPANTTTQTLSVAFGQITLTDGTVISPLAAGTPITVGTGANADTVTPTSVSNSTPNVYQSSNFTAATFSHQHGTGDKVSSATVGLQEALNAAKSAGGGVVVIDAAWYLNGGTAAILDAAIVPANVGIWDTSAGGPFEAGALVPTTTTPLAAPTALTTATSANGQITGNTTGGTIGASGAYRLGVTYVDAYGGETTLSVDTASTAVVTVSSGTANSITVSSPAALAGAVGYRVYMTAASGASLTEILYPVGNAAIVGTALTGYPGALPSFAIGTPVTINAIITGTAKVPAQATGQVVQEVDVPNPSFASYLPFTALGTIAAAATGTVGQINFPAGFFNTLGRTVRFKGTYYVTTNGTGGTVTTELILASIYGVTNIIPFTAASSSIAASALTINFEFDITMVTTATGATGTLECHGTVAYNVAGGTSPVGTIAMDSIQAASSTLDLTKQNTLSVAHLNTTLGTSASQLRLLTVEVLQ
jgi:hypothetical protein